MALLSGEVETQFGFRPGTRATGFRMALLSGEVETLRARSFLAPWSGFRMALLSGEVETGVLMVRDCHGLGVPDGFAIRGS